MLLVVVWVVDKNNEVNSQVKFEFLGLEVLLQTLLSWLQKQFPGLKELVF